MVFATTRGAPDGPRVDLWPDATPKLWGRVFDGKTSSAAEVALFAHPEALVGAYWFAAAPLAADEVALVSNARRLVGATPGPRGGERAQNGRSAFQRG